MDRASLELLLRQGLSLAEIGRRLGRHESTVAYWLAKHGLEGPGQGRHAPRGELHREDLQRLVESGATIGEIAEQLDRSKGTVRHWLKRYGLKTAIPAGQRRSEGARAAWEAGLTRTAMACPSHGLAQYVLDARGYYRCTRCRSDAVSRRRRKVKEILVAEAGGACQLCGYARCLSALEFHHVDPGEKKFALSREGVTRSLSRARAEAEKCVLLCGNCHAEVESGTVALGPSVWPD